MADTTDLGFFSLLARQPSLAAAAQALGVTPPAVSRRLAALEARLGVRLLNRTTRRLSLTPEGERCHFSVRDNGPGIPASERADVLRRFHRLNHEDQPGSGLGLSIVSRIAELHGATVVLADNEAARGLTISVHFNAGDQALASTL